MLLETDASNLPGRRNLARLEVHESRVVITITIIEHLFRRVNIPLNAFQCIFKLSMEGLPEYETFHAVWVSLRT